MAITYTPKLKLPLYSNGNDKHPGRLDNNALMNLIESNVLGSSQGLHASRPGAGTPGRAYFSTDRATLAYDNGTTWIDLVPIGGVVPSGVIVGSTGSEGTSARVARADHSHAIPLATSAVHGLMTSADKSKLDGATTNATANTVALRDASGQISVGSPTVAAHAATKAYVDTASSNASNLSTGTVDPARIANATNALDGLMSKADKALLDGATSGPTFSALARRDSSGALQVIVPAGTGVNYAVNRGYVDSAISTLGGTKADAGHKHDGADITTGTISPLRIANATNALDGLMSKDDKYKLDRASVSSTGDTLALRDANGRIRFGTIYSDEAQSTTSNALTRKDYVDGKTWDGADITSGLINQARIANATSTLNGLMSSTDKAKLDATTSYATANTLILRNANGDFVVNTPTATTHPATKAYVDGQITAVGNASANAVHKHDAADITTGVLAAARIPVVTQSVPGAMSAADKYKLDKASNLATANTLMMADANGRYQVAAPSSSYDVANKAYVDTASSNASNLSTGTVDPARIANATSALDGLMPKADKAKLDAATGANVGSEIVRRYSDGTFTTQQISLGGQPTDISHAARKDYVDAQIGTRAPSSHNHDGADITTGTISPLRIANATSALDGLMPKADKAKLDNASSLATANTLVMNDANGRFQVVTPSGSNDAANKTYVDTASSNASNLSTGTVDPARIANATSALDGLMPKADKAKLDAASASATANTIMMTNSAGVFSVNTPTSTTHAANKSYVDALIAQQVPFGGELGSTYLNTVTTPADYFVSGSANGTTANNYPVNGVGTLSVRRFHNSSIWVIQIFVQWSTNKMFIRSTNSATGWTDWATVASESYVDSAIATRAPLSHNHSGANITSGTISPLRIAKATSALDGLMPKADKAKLDNASSLATANTLVMNDANGRFQVVTPSGSNDAANKTYVDTASSNASNLSTGTVDPARIANASSTVDGLMSKADKALLDGATYSDDANSIMKRTPAGATYVSTPVQTGHAANKSYVDGKFADVFIGTEIPDGANMNNYITPNLYHNSLTASIATGSNYPSGTAGKLEVSKNASSSMIYQMWTEFSSNGAIFYRCRYNDTWNAWKELATAGSNVLSTSATDATLNSYKSPGTSYLYTGSGPYRDARLIEVFADAEGNVFQRDSQTGALMTNVRIRGFDVVSRLWSDWTNL